MSFLGIDQSLNATGVCLISDDGQVQHLFSIDPEARVDAQRLVHIKLAIAAKLSGVKGAALEGYSYNSTGRVFELGEIGGVLKALLYESGISYVSVPPTVLKMFATGSGSASKDQMIKAAKRIGAAPADDNQADALFLAHTARAYTLGCAKHRCEMEAIHTLKHPTKKTHARRVRQLIKAAI